MEIQALDGAENFRIGNLLVKPTRNLFVKGAASYSLEPRIMDVLCKLAAHPREVVSRDILIESVWAVEFGADESLTRAISILRKTFKTAGESQTLIQTIPKRGYRLAVDVTKAIIEPHISNETPQPTLEQTTKILSEPIDDRNAPHQDLNNAPKSIPVKMTAADISGYSPKAQTINPAKNHGARKKFPRIILGMLTVLLIIITVVGVNSYRANQDFGNSVSISQYGRSVAVLPLVDMSIESNMSYFTDGMAEEILSALTQIADLRVAGGTSSFAFKNKNLSISDIGETLKVSHIIDGSVRQHAERIKITIRLNNTSNGAQVWSKSYNGTLKDTIALQEEISQDIMLNLELLLGISFKPLGQVDEREQ